MPWSEQNASENLFREGERRNATPLFELGQAQIRPLDPVEKTPKPPEPSPVVPEPAAAQTPLSEEELQAQVEAYRAAQGKETNETPSAEAEANSVPREQYEAVVAERDNLLREREVLAAQLSDREAHLNTSIGALDSAVRAMRDGATEAVVRLAVMVARRVTDREFEMDPTLVATLSESALDELNGFSNAEVRVHPTDFPTVRDHLAQKSRPHNDHSGVRIVADGEVSRGGCVVSSDGAEVDGSVETRFERLEESLLEAMTSAVARPATLDPHASADQESIDTLQATAY